MTTLAAVSAAFPGNRYSQAAITTAFAVHCLGDASPTAHRALSRVHDNARVEFRHLALPLDQYSGLVDFQTANDIFLNVAVDLGARAVEAALVLAGLAASDVDLIISTTVTGIAVPSVEARIAARIGLRADVVRVPLFGLGCVAGAAGVARVHDYLLGHPDKIAVLLSVELCSLTIQRNDRSMANLIASGLFGDGATAVVAVGSRRAADIGATGPRVVDSRSHLYPGTERAMGWDVGQGGLKIVLGAEVPALVAQYLGPDVKQFLADHDLAVTDVTAWVCHPGGPKVIEAIEYELGLEHEDLGVTWRSLADVGNLSSSSVLMVLRDTLAQTAPPPGTPGLMMAMGPGFCSELVLLQW